MNPSRTATAAAALLVGLSPAKRVLSVAEGVGPNPALPRPDKTLVPTVHVAPAVGWPEGGAPVAAPGRR